MFPLNAFFDGNLPDTILHFGIKLTWIWNGKLVIIFFSEWQMKEIFYLNTEWVECRSHSVKERVFSVVVGNKREGLCFCVVFLFLSLFCVQCLGFPGGCCDNWLINHSTHLWWLLCSEHLSSTLLISRRQIVGYRYVIQLFPNFWVFVFWEFSGPNSCVFSC